MKLKLTALILLVGIIGIISATDASAQKKMVRTAEYTNAITADPIGLIFDVFNANYEFMISAQNSINIRGYYWTISDWNAYGLGGSYRWYLVDLFKDGKVPLEGFSVGPAIQFGFWGYDGPLSDFIADDYGGTSVSIGGEAAYKWIFGGFVVEPVIQVMVPIAEPTGYSGLEAFGLGARLGYAWK